MDLDVAIDILPAQEGTSFHATHTPPTDIGGSGLSPEDGGAPQVRDRVYILGVHVGRERALREVDVAPTVRRVPQNGWDPSRWRLDGHLLLPELTGAEREPYVLSTAETMWIDTWNELLGRLGGHVRLPGFPMWEPHWRIRRPRDFALMPAWKQDLVEKNRAFYSEHRVVIDSWRRDRKVRLSTFPLSRRKLEWQAGDGGDGGRDLWKQLLQLRPSGIRVKQPTWTPALVAMNQASIYGPERRRLTPLEAARLQGFDTTTFTFAEQVSSLSYKQMGNAVNVGAAQFVLRQFVADNAEDVRRAGAAGAALVDAVAAAAQRSKVS